MRHLLFALLLVLSSASRSQLKTEELAENVLLRQTDGLLFLDAEFVAAGRIEQIAWSPDGTQLAAVRRVIPHADVIAATKDPANAQEIARGLVQVISYSLATSKTLAIWTLPAKANPLKVGWIGDLGIVAQIETNGKFSMWIMSPTVSGARELQPPGNTELSDSTQFFVLAPRGGYGVMMLNNYRGPGSSQRTWIQAFNESGWIGKPIHANLGFLSVTWSKDGLNTYISSSLPGETPPSHAVFTYSPSDDQLKRIPAEEKEEWEEVSEESSFRVSESPTPYPTIVAFAEPPPAEGYGMRVVVTSDGGGKELSPTQTAIAYSGRGGLFIRRLVSVRRDVAKEICLEAQRAEAVTSAMQCAFGLLLVAEDADDNLPGNERLLEKVRPYLKNDKMFASFQYTFAGGPLSGVKDPTTTEMGYVPGPGGRAVAYVDGHVRWIPDP